MKLPFIDGWSPKLPPLTSAEARILEALAETVFPPDAGLPISGSEAHVVAYFEEMLSFLPLREQIMIRAMLVGFEVQALVTRPRSLSTFSRLSPEERDKSLRFWNDNPLYFARLLFQALRGLLLWAYVDNAEVGQAMGIRPGDEIIRAQQREAAERSQTSEEAPAVKEAAGSSSDHR
ncbi:MAG: hypothetical protein P1V51_17025 [Deltaproteobacteria bacterium]|nr:hypothetical protein [Deltaproteobacteria bacterium]